MADDIVSEVSTDEKLVDELKVEQHRATVERSVEKNPLANVEGGLNTQLVEMTKRGVNSALFQGVERCIRVLDKGSTSQRHCMAMMISDTINGKSCTSCQKRPNPGVCNPKVINSSMIRLNDQQLKECGLDKDPSYIPPEQRNAIVAPTPTVTKIVKAKVAKETTVRERRPKVVPNQVKIEVTMAELAQRTDIVNVLLKKTLEAIYELPITKFSEAEAIRGTSERIKELLSQQGEQ
jgi:hypothetical protein